MSELTTQPPAASPAAAPALRGPSVKQLAVVVSILAAGIIVTALTSDVTKVSEPGVRLVNDVPYLEPQIGVWTGGELSGLTEQERAILPQDTLCARRQYLDPAGRRISCSIILAGRDVTSIHRPELCLEGQGWRFNEWTESVPVATAPHGRLEVMRMNSVRDVRLTDGRVLQAHSIFAYWFIGKDRVTPHHWERILWTTKDRVWHNTNHRWAYILIHAPVDPQAAARDLSQARDDTMAVVKEFVQDLYATLAVN